MRAGNHGNEPIVKSAAYLTAKQVERSNHIPQRAWRKYALAVQQRQCACVCSVRGDAKVKHREVHKTCMSDTRVAMTTFSQKAFLKLWPWLSSDVVPCSKRLLNAGCCIRCRNVSALKSVITTQTCPREFSGTATTVRAELMDFYLYNITAHDSPSAVAKQQSCRPGVGHAV